MILPSLEYARQDRRLVAGEAIPPKLLLRLMRTSGADRFIVMDLHNDAEAAFSPTGAVLDEISADKYLAHFIRTEAASALWVGRWPSQRIWIGEAPHK